MRIHIYGQIRAYVYTRIFMCCDLHFKRNPYNDPTAFCSRKLVQNSSQKTYGTGVCKIIAHRATVS